MKLSNRMKTELKKRLTSAIAILATLVLVFACSKNLFVGKSSQVSVANVENSDSVAAGSTADIIKDSTGIHVKVNANESEGIRRVEVLQNDAVVQTFNYDGSKNSVMEDVYVSIPFGSTGNISVKVNGNQIERIDVENMRCISNAADLVAFRNLVNGGNSFAGKYVELTNNIDLSSVCSRTLGSWTPIGATGKNFSGVLNGNYYRIQNLYYDSNAYAVVGLFSSLPGTVECLMMENIYINNTFTSSTTHSFTGGFAGTLQGTAYRCGNISGSLSTTNMTALNSGWRSVETGGIVGTSSGKINECFNKASITTNAYQSSGYVGAYAGGIAAYHANYGTSKNNYNTGRIEANGGHCYAGGIFAVAVWSTNQSTLSNSYDTGNVLGTSYNYTRVGALIGENGFDGSSNRSSTVTNCYTITNASECSYWFYNGSKNKTSTAGTIDAGTLKGYANTLGKENWVTDGYSMNGDYPILRWQAPSMDLSINQTYMHVNESIQITVGTNHNTVSLGNISWTSMDASIATVDASGNVTAVGEGTTTVYATEAKYGIKAMAIINVARSGAVASASVQGGGDNVNSVPDAFTAILKEDGTVWTTGDNTHGQLGNGTTTSSTELVQVQVDENTYLTDIVKIATGRNFTFALTKDGKLYGWGKNDLGQVAQGNSVNQLYAVLISGINDDEYLHGIVDISAGNRHGAAIASDGKVYTWGNNGNGQLGIGTTEVKTTPQLILTQNAIRVAVAANESSYLRQNGDVYSFGATARMAMGSLSADVLSPTRNDTSNVVEVFRDSGRIFIRNTAGKYYISGNNAYGEFGNGTTTDNYTLTELTMPGAVTESNPVVGIGGSGVNTTLVLKDGKLFTAGSNLYGQASIGSTSSTITSFTKAKNSDGTNVSNAKKLGRLLTGVGTDQRVTLTYIDNDGYVHAVGNNAYGQFGNRSTTSSNYYTKVGSEYLNYLGEDIEIRVGENYWISKTDFRVEKFNVLYDYTPKAPSSITFTSSSENISLNSSTGMITGLMEGHAILEVTDPETGYVSNITVRVTNDKGEQLELGNKFSVALRSNGEVWSWGSNTFGELGQNSNDAYKDMPCQVTTLGNIIDIGAGAYHAVALDRTGNVYTWGLNNAGQLGTGDTTDAREPIKLSGLSNIVKVDAYKNMTTAIDRSGNLYVWGEGYDKTPQLLYKNVRDIDGELILRSDRRIMLLNGKLIPYIVNAYKVSGSGTRLMVIKNGRSVTSLTADGTQTALSITNAVDVSSSSRFVYVLNDSSNVYTFGKNENGELGNKTNTNNGTPTIIDYRSNIETIAAGEEAHGALAGFDGSIYTTGMNDKGQLGHGDTDNRNKFKLLMNIEMRTSVDRIIEGIGDEQEIEIKLGITLNLKKDLNADTTSNVNVVDETIASLTSSGNMKYVVTGQSIGRTFLNATISGNINGEDQQFATNVEVRIVPEGGVTVPQIKSGNNFSVALKSNGKIETWGGNANGQLGLGHKKNIDEPQEIEGIEETIVEIAVGNNHVLALTEDGKIYGWGLNRKGQVGNGTTADQVSQATVINVAGNQLSKIIRVEAHGNNSYAINEDGDVYAWGKDFGNKAVKIDGVTNAVDVSTSYYVKADGTVYSMQSLQPIALVGTIRAMDEGTDHTVFLTTDGRAYSIGSNEYGQLGTGNTAPVSGNGIAALRRNENDLFENIVAIEAGERYTVILTDDGKVYTVGINKNGEQGLDSNVTTYVATPREVTGVSNVMLVSAGHNHMVVAKNDGSAHSWGLNTVGQLGNRTTKSSLEPVMVGDYVVRANENHIVEGKTDSFTLKAYVDYFNIIKEDVIPMSVLSKNTQVATVDFMSDAEAHLTENEIAKGYTGIRATGIDAGTTNLIITPMINGSANSDYIGIVNVEILPVAGTNISPMVVTTSSHAIALKTNGTVWTYGQNTYGQLGIGTTDAQDEPRQVEFSGLDAGAKIVQVAAGEFHSVALDSNGDVWTWGRNNYYQLGAYSGDFVTTPVKVTGIPKVKRIVAGNNSVMAVTVDNKLVAWGQNAYGELGNGELTNRQTPIVVDGMHDVLDLQGGKSHYIILKTNGKLYSIGSNLYGQLGVDIGDKSRAIEFEEIESTQKFAAISSSWMSNIATTVDGQVYSWGQNTYGQLGTGDKLNKKTLTRISGLGNIVEVNVGKTHSILRDYNGDVWLAGTNSYGQLGDGTTMSTNTFAKSNSIGGILRASAGNTYTVTMKDDGEVYAWGDYNHGNKNLKSRTNSKVPIQIGSNDSSLDTLEVVVKKSEIASILANSEFRFNLIYEENNEASDFTYTCLNNEIADVNDAGNILGIRPGTTWVKVTDKKTGKVNVAIVKVIENTAGYDTYTAPKIASGEAFVASLKEDGSIFLWGYDDSDLIDNDVPYSANVVTTYVDVKAGNNHVVALRKDGTVWVAGQNTYGQLGIGNTKKQTKLVQVSNLTDIVKIAAGENFTVAMDSYGIMYVWGQGYTNKPQVLNTNIRNVSYIAAGGKDQIAVVLPSGQIYGFGSTLNGLLDNFDNAVKVEVGNRYMLILDTRGDIYKYANGSRTKVDASNAVDISSTNNINMYQNVYERAYVWGSNDRGQLGNGTTSGSTTPTNPTNYATDVFGIAAGTKNTYLIDVLGNVYAAGDNQYGQLGNGTKEDTTATSYGQSKVHTIVGDRAFTVEPSSAILEVGDVEPLVVTGNSYNVFKKVATKSIKDYDFVSNNGSIIELQEDDNHDFNGNIRAAAVGKTTVGITDKITGKAIVIERRVVPLNQDRIVQVAVNGEIAEAIDPSNADTYVAKYKVQVPLDDNVTTASVVIKTEDLNDQISIDNGANWSTAQLTASIDITGNTANEVIVVKTSNGTDLLYELEIERISINNAIQSVKVNGFEADVSTEEDDTYEIVVTDLTDLSDPDNLVYNTILVTAEKAEAKVSIKGKTAELGSQSYPTSLERGYIEIPIKVTAESGRAKSYTLKIYSKDEMLELVSINVNNEASAKLEDGTYKCIIADDVNRSSITATAKYDGVYVGINDSFNEIKTSTRSVLTTDDETLVMVVLEASLKVDGTIQTISKPYTLEIYKNKVFSRVQTVMVNGEIVEEENDKYIAYVASNVNSVVVNISAKDANYRIKLDEANALQNLVVNKALEQDETSYAFTVTDEIDGSKKTYTLMVIRGNTDTRIKNITVGKEAYVVDAELTNDVVDSKPVYEAKILDVYDNVDVTVQSAFKNSRIIINGGTPTAKITVKNVTLTSKTTELPIKIVTEDGLTSKDYILRIIRQSDNTSLASVKVNDGADITATTDDNIRYEVHLNNAVNKIAISGVTASEYAAISINGEPEEFQTSTIQLNLTSGVTEIEMKVKSEVGTEKTYTLTIYTISDDTSLEFVKVDGVEATWNSINGRYEIKVNRGLSSYSVKAKTNADAAKVSVDGTEAVQVSTKTVVNQQGETIVPILVTAPNGITSKTYNVAILEKSNNAGLGYVKLNGVPIALDNDGYYTLEVVSLVQSVMIEVGAQDDCASIKLGGDTQTGVWSGTKILQSDNETYTFTITPEDGSAASGPYTIKIRRLDGNTDIETIKVTYKQNSADVEVVPTVLGDGSYFVKIPKIDEDRVILKIVAKKATTKVNVLGTEELHELEGYVELTGEDTIAPIVLTAEDGSVYSTKILLAKISSNTNLKEFYAIEGTKIDNDTIAVDSKHTTISIVAIPENSYAQVKLSESSTYSDKLNGAQTNISGKDEVSVDVLAEDGGSLRTHTLQIVRTYNTALESVVVYGSQLDTEGSVNVVGTTASDIVITAVNDDAIVQLFKNGVSIATGTGSITVPQSFSEETASEYTIKVTGPSPYESYTAEYPLSIRAVSTSLDATIYIDGEALTLNSVTGFYEKKVVGANHTLSAETASTYANVAIEGSLSEGTSDSMEISVEAGQTKYYTVTVTAEDGTEQDCIVEVYRKNNVTTVSGVTFAAISGGTIGAEDALSVLPDGSYYKKVNRHLVKAQIRLTAGDSKAGASINNEVAELGESIKEVDLDANVEIINIPLKIIAEDGTESELNLKVERESNDTSMKKVLEDVNELAKLDDSTYKVVVDSRVTSIDFSAIPMNPAAKVKLASDSTYSSTLAGVEVNISGINSFDVIVIAEDNETTATYTIEIERTFDASIKKIEVDSETISSETSHFEGFVAANEASHTIVLTADNSDAVITLYDLDDNVLATDVGTLTYVESSLSGEKSYKIVIAGPGEYAAFTEAYTLKLMEKSTDATAKLYIEGGLLTLDAGTGTYRYVTNKANNTLKVVSNNEYATINVNNTIPITAVYEKVHSVQTGSTETINVLVTAQNGEVQNYVVELVRLSNNVNITSMKVNDKESTKVSDSVFKNVQSTSENNGAVVITIEDVKSTVSATVDGNTYNATTMVDGKKTLAFDVPLTGVGMKTITVEVVAEDGTSAISELKIVQNPSGNVNVIVTVDDVRAEMLDEATYKVVVNDDVIRSEVSITAEDRNSVISAESESGRSITFNRVLNTESDTTVVSFTVTAQSGITKECELYIVRERGDITIGNRNIASLKVNGKDSTKVGQNLYKSVLPTKNSTANVEIMLEDSSSTIRATVGGNTYSTTSMVDGKKTLTFSVPLTGSGVKSVAIEITGADNTTDQVTLNIVQNSSNEAGVTVKVGGLIADKIEDSTYRIFINSTLASAEVNITADDTDTIVESYGNTLDSGSSITFNKLLSSDGDITVVSFTVTSQSGITKYYDLYIIKESTDNSIGKLYVNGIELNKSRNGRYEAYIDNSAGNPTVKVVAGNEYAYVKIGLFAEVQGVSEEIVEIDKEHRYTTVPIKVRSQSGEDKNECLDIYVTYVRADIDIVKVDDVEAEYDKKTKTFTAIVENALETHEIHVATDNEYMTLEINESIGRGNVTTTTAFAPNEEIKSFPLYVTGETGLTEVYTIVLAQKSSNVGLKSVKVNDVPLTLDATKNQYRKSIDKIAVKAKVEVETDYPYAKVKVSDSTPVFGESGVVWVDLTLDQDEITIPVVVTAADGSTIETYNIVLTRVASEITGKIITQNAENKHVATIKVYRSSDTREIDDPDENNRRELIFQTVTNEDGTYSLVVPNADDYDLVIEKDSYLTHTLTNVRAIPYDSLAIKDINIYAGNIVKYTEIPELTASGELVQNGIPTTIEQIELQDLVALNDNYGEVVTDANWLKYHIYDLNEDGVVNKLDRNILKANFNMKAQTELWVNPEAGAASITGIQGSTLGLTAGGTRALTTTAAGTRAVKCGDYILPIACDYTVTSPYGERVHPVTGEIKKHRGIDISGTHHTGILAIADGEVTFAGVQSGYGNCIEIKHIVKGETVYSFYAHLSEIDVEVGDHVIQGEVIGLEGGAQEDPGHGTSTGHHLHFEIRTASGSGNDVNPNDYIRF